MFLFQGDNWGVLKDTVKAYQMTPMSPINFSIFLSFCFYMSVHYGCCASSALLLVSSSKFYDVAGDAFQYKEQRNNK
jgi:hypothetical protein